MPAYNRACRRVKRPNAATRSCPWSQPGGLGPLRSAHEWARRAGNVPRTSKSSAHCREALPRGPANRAMQRVVHPVSWLALGIDDERRSLRAGASSGLRSSRAIQYRLRSSRVLDWLSLCLQGYELEPGSTWSGPTRRSGD
jgi:hypothetical protein